MSHVNKNGILRISAADYKEWQQEHPLNSPEPLKCALQEFAHMPEPQRPKRYKDRWGTFTVGQRKRRKKSNV